MLVHLEFLITFCERECRIHPNEGRSHKLVVLEEILTDLVGKENCDENVGVVFVERRITALALHEYLRKKWRNTNSQKTGKPLLKCDMIVRQSTQVFKYLHPSHKLSLEAQQDSNTDWLHQMKKVKDVLEGLRSKRTNVLIATSVVEEGVVSQIWIYLRLFASLVANFNHFDQTSFVRRYVTFRMLMHALSSLF